MQKADSATADSRAPTTHDPGSGSAVEVPVGPSPLDPLDDSGDSDEDEDELEQQSTIPGIPVVRVVKTLWKMLSPSRRVVFALLLFFIFFAGLLDMCGMLVIFGFIAGLRVNAHTGERSGRLMRGLRFLGEGPLNDRDYALFAGGLVVGVIIFKNIVSMLVQFSLNRFLMKLNQGVSVGLLQGYLVAPYEEILTQGTSGPTAKINRIFDVFSRCFGAVAQLLADGALLLIVTTLLLFLDVWLTLASATAFGVTGAALYWIMQHTLTAMGRKDRRYRKQANEYLADGIEGLIDTRLRNVRSFLANGYALTLTKTSLLRRRIVALKRLPRSANEILLTSMIVGSVFYLAFTGKSIHDVLPLLALFGYAGLRMTAAITRINVELQTLRRFHEDFTEFYEELAQVSPHLFSGEAPSALPSYLADEKPLPEGNDGRLHRAIVARDLGYSYPGAETPAVNGVSVEIPRGSFVSFCGPSGGGKSTLVLLLMGLLRPQHGEILCDDWNIHEHIRAWHKNLGYVGQQMYLSGRSIRENVAFGVPKSKIDNRRVWEALRLASAARFVREFPKTLRHKLKESGSNLSGGQRQRLMIARALYHDPDIVFFDEATAALDNVTEREITRAIAALSRTKTVICVAHRLSTIQKSDMIHVVDRGRIVDSGTYDELLRSSETFQSLANAPTET